MMRRTCYASAVITTRGRVSWKHTCSGQPENTGITVLLCDTQHSYCDGMVGYFRRAQLRRSCAIGWVLDHEMERAGIGSPRQLREAAESALLAHPEEIEAQVERIMEISRETGERIRAKYLAEHLRCAVCDAPVVGAKRFSRRYCSDRCRQRAHRGSAQS
jgi:hypothetical protein